jgi:hypothetical protein
LILFAPYIAGPLGGKFREAGLNYLDLQGNCFLRIGDRYVVHVEGRKERRAPRRPRGVRAPGVKALFALLAQKDLLERPLRDVARAAGTNHQTALEAVHRLAQAGAVVQAGRRRGWLPRGRRAAFELWVADYGAVLRPALYLGRYRTPHPTPEDLDRALTGSVGTGAGCWYGGTAAGHRVLPHYRGAHTTLHVQGERDVLLRTLRALPDPQGPLVLFGLPGPLATDGVTPDTVHPLLVYAEMLQTDDDRAAEAAELVKKQALPEFA